MTEQELKEIEERANSPYFVQQASDDIDKLLAEIRRLNELVVALKHRGIVGQMIGNLRAASEEKIRIKSSPLINPLGV